MNRQTEFIQAYKQTPWRKQVQLIGLFSAVITILVTGAGIYLYVTANTATLGREIQDMQIVKEDLQKKIEDQQSKLASLKSARALQGRAIDLGYQQVNPDTSFYLVVPGYGGRQPAELAPPARQGAVVKQGLRPEYTITLFDWMKGFMAELSLQTGATQ